MHFDAAFTNTCLIWVFCDVKEYYKIIKILVVKFNILMSFVWQIYMTFLNFRTCWNSWKVIISIEIWALWRDCTDGLVLCYVELFLDYFYNRKQIFFKKSSWGWKSSVVFWEVLQWATFMSVMIIWFMIYYPQPFWHQGPISWKAVGGGERGTAMVLRWFRCIYCVLYFYYYLSSTSDYQALVLRDRGPLIHITISFSKETCSWKWTFRKVELKDPKARSELFQYFYFMGMVADWIYKVQANHSVSNDVSEENLDVKEKSHHAINLQNQKWPDRFRKREVYYFVKYTFKTLIGTN